MKTFTTLVDIRQILKFTEDGMQPDAISENLGIDLDTVKNIISIKLPKKTKPKKAATDD